MKITNTEMRLLDSATFPPMPATAFQLPSLNCNIPVQAEMVTAVSDYSALATALLDAGVIDPADIPDTVGNAAQIVNHGLAAWFKPRISGLNYMRFDVALYDAEAANGFVKEMYLDASTEFTSFALAFEGSHESPFFYVENTAKKIEALAPGLFLTAFSTLTHASWRTIDVRCPEAILNNVTYQLWECDLSEVTTDEAAMEAVIERFGETEASDEYLPSKVIPGFGDGYCFTKFSKTKHLKKAALKKLAKSENALVAEIAAKTLELNANIEKVKKFDTGLPGVADLQAHSISVGCTMLFRDDPVVLQYVDDEVNDAYNAGDATELIGIESIPTTAAELKTYFSKLDLCLAVVRQINALIPLLADLT
jgi:PRTRC genetic system protein F